MARGSEADYNEGTKTLRIWDRDKPNATEMTSIKADSVADAGLFLVARGWRMVDEFWSYSALDGFSIKIEKSEE